MNAKRILVTGATGQQDGAVARQLLKQQGFAVRALTRDPAKPAAKAWRELRASSLGAVPSEHQRGNDSDVPMV